jgi:cellulose synthase/poly-beta-1,6-N-acetylglucosamine synthase-like glycosyltransferase
MGWQATCLTEDMEFTMRLSLNNVIVAWANDAKVYDEKPLTFSQSWKQRTRWMQGHADVASRFVIPLWKKSVHEKTLLPFDCAIYLLQPLRIVTMGMITVMAWVNAVYPESDLIVWGLLPDYIWNTIVVLQFCWTPMVLALEKKFTSRTIIGYFAYMVYSLTWVPIAVLGIIRKNKKEWFHTQHTRTISLQEIN